MEGKTSKVGVIGRCEETLAMLEKARKIMADLVGAVPEEGLEAEVGCGGQLARLENQVMAISRSTSVLLDQLQRLTQVL